MMLRVVTYRNLVSTNWVFDLVGLGLYWGFGTKGLGPGLDIHSVRVRCHCRRQDQESFDSV